MSSKGTPVEEPGEPLEAHRVTSGIENVCVSVVPIPRAADRRLVSGEHMAVINQENEACLCVVRPMFRIGHCDDAIGTLDTLALAFLAESRKEAEPFCW